LPEPAAPQGVRGEAEVFVNRKSAIKEQDVLDDEANAESDDDVQRHGAARTIHRISHIWAILKHL
jgi:hypothetical protein